LKTLLQLHEEFLEHERIANRSATYVRALRYDCARCLKWLQDRHGVERAEQLTVAHIEAWAKHTTTRSTNRGLPIRPNSVAKQFQCDRAFLKWLSLRGVVPSSFVAAVPDIKLPRTLPTSVLTHQQMMRLLNSVNRTTPEGFQLSAMLEFLYSTGVRVAELLGLNIEHVDLKNRQAVIWGKGSKERIVPVGATAAKATEAYLKGFRPLAVREPMERALWLDQQGRRIPYHTFRRQLLDVAVRTKLSCNVTAHTFRRSFTTEMIRGGANPWLVRDVLGQVSVEALAPYIKLVITDLKKTLARCHPRERD
jgi:integrase/recombinase XerD